MKGLDILYEDNSVIIVNKPAGLAVQGGKGVKTSVDKILAEMRRTDVLNPAPLLVHRLDKDTSGVLLAAKTKEAAARFSRFFNSNSSQKAVKQYIAICADSENQGNLKKKEGVITAELEVHGKIKESRTKYKIIKEGEKDDLKYSVLEIVLDTGRMHQIRRHLAMTGFPILGDDKYGNFALNKRFKFKRLFLHAKRLVIKELNIDISAPLPEYIEKFV